MPHEIGSPEWEANRQALIAEQREHMATIGWALMGVFTDSHAWVYTIGNDQVGLPELLMTSADPNGTARILNGLTEQMRAGLLGPLAHGVEFNPPGENWTLRCVEVPHEPRSDRFNGWYAAHGFDVGSDVERELRKRLWVLQIVWPGHDARGGGDPYEQPLIWPTVEEPWRDQPIFGEVWW